MSRNCWSTSTCPPHWTALYFTALYFIAMHCRPVSFCVLHRIKHFSSTCVATHCNEDHCCIFMFMQTTHFRCQYSLNAIQCHYWFTSRYCFWSIFSIAMIRKWYHQHHCCSQYIFLLLLFTLKGGGSLMAFQLIKSLVWSVNAATKPPAQVQFAPCSDNLASCVIPLLISLL